MITEVIQESVAEFADNSLSKQQTWDMTKVALRDHTVLYCKLRSEITSLESKLKTLNEMNNTNLQTDIDEIEQRLNTLYEYSAKGAHVRSRAAWTENGKQNNNFVLGLEKSRLTNKTMCQLKDKTGNLLTDQSEILQAQADYYTDMYASKT
jgi:hypothetical protein